jgi:hypothetical protein
MEEYVTGTHLRAACAGALLFSLTALAQMPVPADQKPKIRSHPSAMLGRLRVPTTRDGNSASGGDARAEIPPPVPVDQGQINYFSNLLPSWEYCATAIQDNAQHCGMILGSSPTFFSSTTVSTPVIPVILNITLNGVTWNFDPTKPDAGCLGGTNTAQSLFWTSPLLVPANFTINGQFIGPTQYGDAIARAQFWNYPNFQGKFAQRLNLAPTQYPPLTINMSDAAMAQTWYLPGGQCGAPFPVPFQSAVNPGNSFAGIDIGVLDPLLRNYIATHPVLGYQFPIFVLYKTIIFTGDASNFANCCIAGYHDVIAPSQTYAVADFEENAYFNAYAGWQDTVAASSEINEWINDPFNTNSTPAWGNVGAVVGCQSTLEVADPLVGSNMPPINQAGFTYHLQEIAFFNWFFGGATNYGAGTPNASYPNGYFSSNGTFNTYSTLCQ